MTVAPHSGGGIREVRRQDHCEVGFALEGCGGDWGVDTTALYPGVSAAYTVRLLKPNGARTGGVWLQLVCEGASLPHFCEWRQRLRQHYFMDTMLRPFELHAVNAGTD